MDQQENQNNAPETGCCPRFNPEPWQDKVFDWNDKKFVKDKVFTFFFVPLNFGKVIMRVMKKIEMCGANAQDWMGLSDHTSPWNMDIYVAVDKDVTGAENISLSGKFYSRVYEGDFKDTKKWCKDFDQKAKEKGFEVKKMYMWYTTCPKCAKVYGVNYTVIIAQV